MFIALPNCQGRVSPVFDVAARLLVVRLDGQRELERREVLLFHKEPEGIVRSLRELNIGMLICGGISQGLKLALEKVGIRVLAQVCGELDPVLAAYRGGKLPSPQFTMPGCCAGHWDTRVRKPSCKRRRASRHAF